MSYRKRLDRAFEHAVTLPLHESVKYILFSDCHRGSGTTYDNFLKNQHLYIAALQYYMNCGYHYIELGDGEELWENRDRNQIINSHCEVYKLFALMEQQSRITRIFGNHDHILKRDLKESVVLRTCDNKEVICMTHGHQVDFKNSVMCSLTRFLVRYLWRPLEQFGVNDPTSAAKNYRHALRVERKLENWAAYRGSILITGHTHRPRLNDKMFLVKKDNGIYLNTGSCVHPYGITGIEINGMRLYLVKWSMQVCENLVLCVRRESLAGPLEILK